VGHISGAMRTMVFGTAALVMAGVMSACGDTATSTAIAALTPASALKAAQAYFSATDPRAQILLEGGPLRTIDDASLKEHPVTGALPTPPPGYTPPTVTVEVPHQSAYPLQFLAGASDTLQGKVVNGLWLFSQTALGAPWQAVQQVALSDGTPLPVFVHDAQGYAELVTPDQYQGYTLNVSAVQVEYASDLTTGDSSSGDFAPGPLSSGQVDDLTQLVNQYRAQQLVARVDTEPMDSGFWAYRLRDGGAYVLFTCAAVTTLSPAGGVGDVRISTGDGISAPAPGLYSTVTMHRVLQVGAIDPPATPAGARVTVVGLYAGPVSATGSAVSPGGTATAPAL
jgi:hypothetical protein